MIFGYILIIIFVALDQLTKHLARFFLMESGETVVWIANFLEIGYHENPGMSYGLLQNSPYAPIVFALVTIIALLVFGYLFIDSSFKDKKVYSLSIAFFLAGTIGNGIDRLIFGYVIDFLHYPFLVTLLGNLGNFYNNLADMFLFAAIILFSIDLFFFESKRQKAKGEINEDISS